MKSYIIAGALALIAIPVAQSQFVHKKNSLQATPLDQSANITLEELVAKAPVILIAKVMSPPSVTDKPVNQDKMKLLDIERDRKRITEGRKANERVYSDIKIDKKIIKLKTTQTLKGPKTDILGLPITDKDFESASTSDLFLIMLGVKHPDAIRPIVSIQDPWVKSVQSYIE